MLQNEKEIGEISLIEKVSKLRYNYIKWYTIAWALCFGAVQIIISGFLENHLLRAITGVIAILGWVLWLVQGAKFRKVRKMIDADENLREALNGELYKEYARKAAAIGYLSMIITAGLFFVLTLFLDIPAKIVCGLLIYVGVLSGSIAGLVLNKD